MDSDPEVVLVEKIEEDEISTDKDSGMESAIGSKDETPERKPSTPEEEPKQSEPVKPAAAPEAAPVAAASASSSSAAAPAQPAAASAPSGPSSSRPSASTPPQPTKTVARTSANDYDDVSDEPDESLGERLWGLTEMFPEPVRQFSGAVTDLTVRSVKGLYSLTCNVSWIFFTTSMVLLAPVVFEVERAQMEEMQKSQQKQVLLGPGTAVGGGGAPGGMPALPPMAAAR
ncbi:mitochondrial import receptor subunit TOM22 homolog isoform X1 [Anopheles moucheti]|uniref:mitochondrial import receptor subunit TOM22 homolog isoform X1 n=1 Tax=Anopheles moucheti TaxID=186751 RepID=UPI0022F094C9|nr:mitochondrial import receptor subunit TOM22 homolog isoform X1 [Anopheles moucheti]